MPSAMHALLMRGISCLLLCFLCTACATNGEPMRAPDPRDPYEGFNRAMYQFNDAVDRAVLKPTAKGYRYITPDPVETSISNFFDNLGTPLDIFNNAFQGEFLEALSDTGRLIVNSTIGVLGFFDPASKLGMPAHEEDFGQTLGVWGVPSGPYLVLPFLGSSTVRDTAGMVPDYYLDPLFYYENDGEETGLKAMWVIDTRARLLDAETFLKDAYDPYSFIRDAYLQRRTYLIHDGRPPVETAYPDYGAYDDYALPEESDEGNTATDEATDKAGEDSDGAGEAGNGTPAESGTDSPAPPAGNTDGNPG